MPYYFVFSDTALQAVQAAYLATAKWLTALGVVDSLPLLQCFLSSSNNWGNTSHRSFVGAALRRPFSIGASGHASQPKNTKIRDALFALMALAMPVEPTQEPALLQGLVPHLLDALQPQLRAEAAAESSPASALLSLLIHECCRPEIVVEMLQQRQAGQSATSAPLQLTDATLSSLLVSPDTVKLLVQVRQDISVLLASPLTSSLPIKAQAEPAQQEQQKSQDVCTEETQHAATPAATPDSQTGNACTESSVAPLSTRSQRVQRSSGAALVTARRTQYSLRDDLYQELKGRLDSGLLALMFPPTTAASSTSGSRQAAPQLLQLKAAYDAWTGILCLGGNASVPHEQQAALKYPLQGDQSITDLLLKWIALWWAAEPKLKSQSMWLLCHQCTLFTGVMRHCSLSELVSECARIRILLPLLPSVLLVLYAVATERWLGPSCCAAAFDTYSLRWLCYWVCSISETQQQQRTPQAQESVCLLLQMLQLLLRPYHTMRVALPLYEQQQILQQLLDVASANTSIATATSATAPRPIAKQLRKLVREALLLLATIVEDRPKFLSAVHRSLIRCKSKEYAIIFFQMSPFEDSY